MIRGMSNKESKMKMEQRTCQVWAVLAFAASRGHVLTYTELEQATGFIRAGLGEPLQRIQFYCRQKRLPNLSSLVVNKGGIPSKRCVRDRKGEDWAQTQFRVHQHKWLEHGNPGVDNFREVK